MATPNPSEDKKVEAKAADAPTPPDTDATPDADAPETSGDSDSDATATTPAAVEQLLATSLEDYASPFLLRRTKVESIPSHKLKTTTAKNGTVTAHIGN